ncbi:MAG: 50S ribosomal protein L29 [Phycisphaerales bacterium]
MKYKEVKRMTGEEIDLEIDRMQRRLHDLRVQRVTDKVEDPSQFKKIRRDIARMLTERRAREISAAAK